MVSRVRSHSHRFTLGVLTESRIGGLSFIGVAVGIMLGVVYNVIDNRRYVKTEKEHGGEAPPEARLPPVLVAAVCLPVGIFWFAWTNYPSIHWIVCIIGTAPFGCKYPLGCLLRI